MLSKYIGNNSSYDNAVAHFEERVVNQILCVYFLIKIDGINNNSRLPRFIESSSSLL